jgi:hypothetical protein
MRSRKRREKDQRPLKDKERKKEINFKRRFRTRRGSWNSREKKNNSKVCMNNRSGRRMRSCSNLKDRFYHSQMKRKKENNYLKTPSQHPKNK